MLVLFDQNRHRLAMTSKVANDGSAPRLWLPVPFLLLFLVLTSLIEFTLIAADYSLIFDSRLRPFAYQYGAFWAGLLDNWRPNYAAQPYLMFVTYSFLHAGFWHLSGNMIGLIVLIQLNAPWMKMRGLFVVYIASTIGGALGFALLGSALNPMVGASGALFGLAGSWKWQDWKNSPVGRRRNFVLVRDIFLLILLNLLMWYMQDGALAWEAHFGGFVAGLSTMALIDEIRKRRRVRC